MFESARMLAGQVVIERLVLLVNHVLASEPVAVERLRPHAGRSIGLRFDGWPSFLPALPSPRFRVTPAGLIETGADELSSVSDLVVAVDASNPALSALRAVAGDRPAIAIAGDAAFAADVNWLFEHVRWDIEDDLARLVGDAPAREFGKLGSAIARAVRGFARAVQPANPHAPPGQPASRAMRHVGRFVFICVTFLRYGLDEIALSSFRQPWVRLLVRLISIGRRHDAPRGVRLRQGLERLGPIFVKFGQLLSTRRDLLPLDIVVELAKLQDRVPPFPAEVARRAVERAFGRPLEALFASFEAEPVASASIAQVHFAVLKDGREVAVKVLRPGMLEAIDADVALMRQVARWVERLSADARRLKPREVVAEFDNYLHDELDLVREAANAAQLRRNMQGLGLVMIPEIVWDLCTTGVIVMERMKGVPISHVQRLREAGVDIRKLARDGVTIFFTQVFRDGFFHADMHPGNIQVSLAPGTFGRYIALDFGIVGTLTEHDKDYLAQNFIAFFRRDYKRVAELHVESGWVPPTTRVDELEGAIRAVCEPQFDRPLKDISLGQVLLRLFQTSRRFNVEIQPQLVLLQKTLLNVEGLGRDLDPDLDLWNTAKPFLERWMHEQIGWRGFVERLREEAPRYVQLLPDLPRLLHASLQQRPALEARAVELILLEQQRTNRLLQSLLYLAVGFLLGLFVMFVLARLH